MQFVSQQTLFKKTPNLEKVGAIATVADPGENLTGAYIPVVGGVGVVGVARIEVGFTHRHC